MKGFVVCPYTYLEVLASTGSKKAAEEAFIFESDTDDFEGDAAFRKIANVLSHPAHAVRTISAFDLPFATPHPHHASVWLDDEGLYTARAFLMGAADFWSQPLAGRIFVTGPIDDEGDSTSALIDPSALRGMFQPITRMQAQHLAPHVPIDTMTPLDENDYPNPEDLKRINAQ